MARINSTPQVTRACLCILRSLLQVTQRVPPTCTRKTLRTTGSSASLPFPSFFPSSAATSSVASDASPSFPPSFPPSFFPSSAAAACCQKKKIHIQSFVVKKRIYSVIVGFSINMKPVFFNKHETSVFQ